MYEPYIGILDNGEIAIFYSSEKHVTESVAYEQTVSERVSSDNGVTWGDEIFVAWDPDHIYAKPGMPVFTRMSDGRYIVVFEDGYHDGYNVHYKISSDGKTWDMGLGKAIPDQLGAPYITRLSNGRLMVISNSLNVSFSDDNATTWRTNNPAPWSGSFPDYCWASCYEIGPNKIAVMGSAPRTEDGHNVKLRFGTMELSGQTMPYLNDFNYGNDYGFTKYGGSWSVTNNAYCMENGTGKAIVGDTNWKDYEVEVDLQPTENNINSGIVFRVSSPGNGADEMKGYFAGIDNNGVILGKMDNSWTSLSQFPMTINKDQQYHLKVKAAGNEIKVYLDDMTAPKIIVEDSDFTNGQVGVRSCESRTVFDNFMVQERYEFPFEDNFEDGNDDGWKKFGGSWSVEDGMFCIVSGIGKALIGEKDWQNYTMEADIKIADSEINSGLVFNVTEPGNGPDEMKGYFAGMNGNGVVLGKMDNDWVILQSADIPVRTDVWYHMKVQIKDGEISVFVDDMENPQIIVSDTSFLYGKAGVRVFDCKTYFDNIVVY